MFPLLACQEEEPAKQIGSGPAQLQLQLAELPRRGMHGCRGGEERRLPRVEELRAINTSHNDTISKAKND